MEFLLDTLISSSAAENRGDVDKELKQIYVNPETYEAICSHIVRPRFTIDTGASAPKIFYKDFLILIKE